MPVLSQPRRTTARRRTPVRLRPVALVRPNRHEVVVLLGLAALVAVLGAAVLLGPVKAAAVVIAGVAGLVLLDRPRWAVALALLVPIAIENNKDWGTPVLTRVYDPLFVKTSLSDLLLYGALVAVLLLAVRRDGLLRVPSPFAAAYGFLGLLFVAGLLNGVLGGDSARFQVVSTVQTFIPFFIAPLLVVNVVERGPDLVRVLRLLAALTVFKAVTGLFVVWSGLQAPGNSVPALTFYQPAANLMLLVFLLAVIAMVAARLPRPRWTLVLAAVVGLALLLSYRRTFWLAFVVCAVVVVPLASGRAGRRLILPAAILVLLAGGLAFKAGFSGSLQGPVITRLQSINPSKLTRNDQDRYRLTERRNVLAELRAHPILGIGVGVRWHVRTPLAPGFEDPDLEFYTHTGFFWHWLKDGILGALAYAWVLIAGLVGGIRVWRRHPDPLVRAFGLGAGFGFVGLAVVEQASSVIGPDPRGGLVAGLLFGLLAVAHRDLAAASDAAPASSIAPA